MCRCSRLPCLMTRASRSSTFSRTARAAWACSPTSAARRPTSKRVSPAATRWCSSAITTPTCSRADLTRLRSRRGSRAAWDTWTTRPPRRYSRRSTAAVSSMSSRRISLRATTRRSSPGRRSPALSAAIRTGYRWRRRRKASPGASSEPSEPGGIRRYGRDGGLPDFVEPLAHRLTLLRIVDHQDASRLHRHRAANEMLAVGEHEAVLHLGGIPDRPEDEHARGVDPEQVDQARTMLAHVVDVVERDEDAAIGAAAEKAREDLDALRRIQFELRQVRIEDAQLAANQTKQRAEPALIVSLGLEKGAFRVGGGSLDHRAAVCSHPARYHACSSRASASGTRAPAGSARSSARRASSSFARAGGSIRSPLIKKSAPRNSIRERASRISPRARQREAKRAGASGLRGRGKTTCGLGSDR